MAPRGSRSVTPQHDPSAMLTRRANLGGGQIAGVVVGTVVGFLLLLLCGYPLLARWLLKRRTDKEKGSVDGLESQDGGDDAQLPWRHLTRRGAASCHHQHGERGPATATPSGQTTKNLASASASFNGMMPWPAGPQQQMPGSAVGPSQQQGAMPASFVGVPYPLMTTAHDGHGHGHGHQQDQDPGSFVESPMTNYITAQGQNALYYDPTVPSEALGMTRAPTTGAGRHPRSESLRSFLHTFFGRGSRQHTTSPASGSAAAPQTTSLRGATASASATAAAAASDDSSPNSFILAQSAVPEGMRLGLGLELGLADMSHSPVTMAGPPSFDMMPPQLQPQPRSMPHASAMAVALSSAAATPGVPAVPSAAMESRKPRPPTAVTMTADAQQHQHQHQQSAFTDSPTAAGPDGMTDAEFVASLIADPSWRTGQLDEYGAGLGMGGLPTGAGGSQPRFSDSPSLTPEQYQYLVSQQQYDSAHTPLIQDPNNPFSINMANENVGQYHQYTSQQQYQQQHQHQQHQQQHQHQHQQHQQQHQHQQYQHQHPVIIKPEYSPIPDIHMIDAISPSYQLDASAAALKREHRISQGSDISHLTYRSDMSNLPPFQNSAFPSSAQNTPATSGFSPASNDSPPDLRHSSSPPLPARIPQPSPKIYTCRKCEKDFDQYHKLNHHMRYHDKIHACTYPNCEKSFGTKTHLHRHINDIHERAKKYYCTETGCVYSRTGGRSFPRKDNLRRHLINIHQVVPTRDPDAEADAAAMEGAFGQF